MTVEIACKTVVFHFNKHHLVDPTTPMWIIKANGQTMYVDHVEANLPWSTKETASNTHTKGSIKFKNALLTIDDQNCATLTHLTSSELTRLRAIKQPHARIIVTSRFDEIAKWLRENEIKHGSIKTITGECGSYFQLCDIERKEDIVMMALIFNNSYRILQPNEIYYRTYEDRQLMEQLTADEYYEGQDDEE